MNHWENIEPTAPEKVKVWKPKKPEVLIPVAADIPMTDSQWELSLFPFNPIPNEVYTHVKVSSWRVRIKEMEESPSMQPCLETMGDVLSDLSNGCDSTVGPPDSVEMYSVIHPMIFHA